MAPIVIEISGNGSVEHKPERGVLHLTISSSGYDQNRATGDVESTASQIQAKLRTLSTTHEQTSATSPADEGTSISGSVVDPILPPVDEWSTGSIQLQSWEEKPKEKTVQPYRSRHRRSSSSDHTDLNSPTTAVPATNPAQQQQQQPPGPIRDEFKPPAPLTKYAASLELTACFRDFARLAKFTSWLGSGAVPHVSVLSNVEWTVLPATDAKLRRDAIGIAYADAHSKAQAYAAAICGADPGTAAWMNGERASVRATKIMHDDMSSRYLLKRQASSYEHYRGGRRSSSPDPVRTTLEYAPSNIAVSVQCNVTFEISAGES